MATKRLNGFSSLSIVKKLWEEYWATRSVTVRDKLVEIYYFLLEKQARIIKKHHRFLTNTEDLISAAHPAITKAVEAFSKRNGTKFEYFARVYIRRAMLNDRRSRARECRRVRICKNRRILEIKRLVGAKTVQPLDFSELIFGLSETDQRIILLAIEGHEAKEIAKITGLDPSVVWQRCHRVRKAIKASLKDESDD